MAAGTIRNVIAVGLVVVLAAALLLFIPFEGGDEPGGDLARSSSSSDTASQPTEPKRETRTYENTMIASAGTEEAILVAHQDRVLDGRPVNLTAVLVEFTWSTPTSVAGLDTWYVAVNSEAEALNRTVGSDEPVRLWVTASAYEGGSLSVFYGPTADQMPVGAVVAAEIDIYVTTFAGGPPDRAFTAFEG